MNILIKLMSIVSLVIAPTLASLYHSKDNVLTIGKNIEMKITEDKVGGREEINVS